MDGDCHSLSFWWSQKCSQRKLVKKDRSNCWWVDNKTNLYNYSNIQVMRHLLLCLWIKYLQIKKELQWVTICVWQLDTFLALFHFSLFSLSLSALSQHSLKCKVGVTCKLRLVERTDLIFTSHDMVLPALSSDLLYCKFYYQWWCEDDC